MNTRNDFPEIRWEWSDSWGSIPARVVDYTKYLLQRKAMLDKIASLEEQIAQLKAKDDH